MHDSRTYIRGLLFAGTLAATLAATAATPVKNLAPLKGPINLTLTTVQLPVLPASDALDTAYQEFRRATASAPAARDALVNQRNQCAARSFSVQDQQEAGCQGTDTVAQCNDKLESWCTRRAGRQYRLANIRILRSTEKLKATIDAYIEQVRRLPAED